MKHLTKIFIMSLITLSVFCSCKNGKQAQKAVEWAKQLVGKTVKASKKSEFITKHGDDVISHLELEKVSCSECDGEGIDSWGNECDECDGDGYVYVVNFK